MDTIGERKRLQIPLARWLRIKGEPVIANEVLARDELAMRAHVVEHALQRDHLAIRICAAFVQQPPDG